MAIKMTIRKALRSRPRRNSGRAFTLIELLIVIAIIAMLVSVLLPSLSQAKQLAKNVMCLSNLRNFAMAAQTYAEGYRGTYPIASYSTFTPKFTSYAWDFITSTDADGNATVKSGLLWQGDDRRKAQQCPSFDGAANWLSDPYTGYNYNTSYIGRGMGTSSMTPANLEDVRRPSNTAMFGDGEYGSGANKFMRAPWGNPADGGHHGKKSFDIGFSGRSAGTQGYRHLQRTNVAFCDGHAASWSQRFTDTYAFDKSNVAEGTGFLSADNNMYDLE